MLISLRPLGNDMFGQERFYVILTGGVSLILGVKFVVEWFHVYHKQATMRLLLQWEPEARKLFLGKWFNNDFHA